VAQFGETKEKPKFTQKLEMWYTEVRRIIWGMYRREQNKLTFHNKNVKKTTRKTDKHHSWKWNHSTLENIIKTWAQQTGLIRWSVPKNMYENHWSGTRNYFSISLTLSFWIRWLSIVCKQ
jgi:hypothetical protein